ncbi:hypothetical protein CTI14_69550, partial [Methylobacterium radiotolerans]
RRGLRDRGGVRDRRGLLAARRARPSRAQPPGPAISAPGRTCSASPGATGPRRGTRPARATGCSPGSAISGSAPRAC